MWSKEEDLGEAKFVEVEVGEHVESTLVFGSEVVLEVWLDQEKRAIVFCERVDNRLF